jgi:hypothetical protein
MPLSRVISLARCDLRWAQSNCGSPDSFQP